MTADWLAAFLILGSLAVIALLIVTHLDERIDADETVPYLPADRDAEWDRHVAEAIAHTQIARFDQPVGTVLRALEGGKR